MRRGLPWLLLALSLALNLFFVAGTLYTGGLAAGSEDEVAAQLNLDEAQEGDLAALRQRTLERREARRNDRGRSTEDLLATLSQAEFDGAALKAQLMENNESWNSYMVETYEDLHGFMAGLEPAQRAKLLELAKDRRFLRVLVRGPRS